MITKGNFVPDILQNYVLTKQLLPNYDDRGHQFHVLTTTITISKQDCKHNAQQTSTVTALDPQLNSSHQGVCA